jgi:hypothetical protein
MRKWKKKKNKSFSQEDYEKTIGKLRLENKMLEKERTYLLGVLQEKELLINSLKSERSNKIKANHENKKKWLYGFYGEDGVD